MVHGDAETPFTFTGLRREDAKDDLYSAQYRHLRPGLGRWTRRDPAGFVDGPGLYRYVLSQPTRLVDPTGESWVNLLVAGAALYLIIPPAADTVERIARVYFTPNSDREFWSDALDLSLQPSYSTEPQISRVRNLNLTYPCFDVTYQAHPWYWSTYASAAAITARGMNLTWRGPAVPHDTHSKLMTLTHEARHTWDGIDDPQAELSNYLFWREFYERSSGAYNNLAFYALQRAELNVLNENNLDSVSQIGNGQLRPVTPEHPNPMVGP